MPSITSSITQRFLINMILLTWVSLGLWGLVWVHDEHTAFRVESKSLRETLIEDRRVLIRDQVAGGVEEMVADRPEMEGRNMLDVTGAKGESGGRDAVYTGWVFFWQHHSS